MKIKIFILTIILVLCLGLAKSGFGQDKVITKKSETITFGWDANTETNLAGYRLYYASTRAELDVQNFQSTEGVTKVDVNIDKTMTEVTIDPLPSNGDYYFCLTAYNDIGNESLPSDAECCYILVNYPPEVPEKPKGFSCLPMI